MVKGRQPCKVQLSNLTYRFFLTELIYMGLASTNGLKVNNFVLTLSLQCTAVIRWIEATSETLPARGYEQAYGIWNGKDFLPILEKHLGITAITLEMYKVFKNSKTPCVKVGKCGYHSKMNF